MDSPARRPLGRDAGQPGSQEGPEGAPPGRGNEAQEILAEAQEEESDLIVLGCTGGGQCLWQGPAPVPQRVVNDADCSVLLVKEEQPITRILACLDQSYISQDSLEMINQMATMHGAQLELIGLSGEGGLKKDVYRRLIEIGDYYEDRQIKVSTRLDRDRRVRKPHRPGTQARPAGPVDGEEIAAGPLLPPGLGRPVREQMPDFGAGDAVDCRGGCDP